MDHARQTYIAEIDRIVSDQTSPVTPENPCTSGAEEFELHVQPDGSSLPGADICVWGSDTDAGPVDDENVSDPTNEVLSAEKLAELEWKKAKAAPDWQAKKEAEAIWKAKLEAEKEAEKEATIAAPTEPQFGVQCFDQDRVSGGVGEIPCQPYRWHPQPGQEIKPRCSVDDWFSDEPWHDSYCDVDYDHHRDDSVWSNSPVSDWSDPSEPSTSNTSGFDTLT